MIDAPLLVLVVVAIFIGWLLGRWGSWGRKQLDAANSSLSREYFRGLNHLLNEESDKAIEIFIQALEVNNDTIETHLALGNMFRRKGEVDRATRVHQNLLARPSLTKEQQGLVQEELARDFFAAGLLDRAERLLLDLIQSGGKYPGALKHLLRIYEQEKEWSKAIEIGKSLLSQGDDGISLALAHYYCELAQIAIKVEDAVTARKYLRQALRYDRSCVRGSLLLGQLEFQQGQIEPAIKAFKRVRYQDPDYLSESISPLAQCYSKSGNEEELAHYLSECLSISPAISIMLALVETVKQRSGEEEASKLIASYLKQRPSVRGLNKLIDFHIEHSDGRAKENLTILRTLTEKLIAHKPVYHCVSCGFSSKTLYWLCPACQHWGTVKPIQGLEGE
ncbi:MAG: lipopolysaccharide assembly protein LapB [Gammaproteobacteria bacterium]|nr:MAG: lipopolysaccharide assembly protein LapB [Gammaproteobacteria bacterium]